MRDQVSSREELRAEIERYTTGVPEGEEARALRSFQSLKQLLNVPAEQPIVLTSALDNTTEQRIQAALRQLTAGRTTFIIAHRLSTVRHADLILVMRDGQIAEQGTFEELIALDGTFAALNRQGDFFGPGSAPLEPQEEDAEPVAARDT